MALTKEDFDYIKKELTNHYFGSVELEIDGYKVTLTWGLRNPFSRVITTLVNDQLNPQWMDGDTPESKFWRPASAFSYRPEFRKELRRLGKRYLKQQGVDPDKKRHYRSPYWTSFKTLFAHFKTFENAKLIKNEEAA